MTSANVLQAPAAQGQSVNANTKTAKSCVCDNVGVSASFTSFLQGTAGPVSGTDGSAEKPAFTRSGEAGTYSQRKIAPAEMKTAAEKIAESSKTLEESKDTLLDTVAEKLGLDEYQLEDAMSVLGLGTFDLLDPQKLAQLFMQVSGDETEADLLLNPQFVELMQDVSNMEADLMGKLGISAPEMDEVLAQLDLLEQPVPLEQSVGMEQTMETEAGTVDVPLENQQNTTENVDIEGVESDLSAPETFGEVSVKQDNGDAENAGRQNENPAQRFSLEKGAKDESGVSVLREGNLQSTGSFTGSLEAQVVLDTPAGENVYSTVDPLDVIRQIAQNVRVGISQENTSMEMQLNPENLGKIYLQVTAREGSVHATIAAQNEAVRAALETQVAELKENLNQAGVKVDAVEVTVASHEFEKNLEQNERQQQNEGERQQEMVSRRKNSGVTLSGGTEEILSEEEALAARIMQDNGNSVDFTA